MKTVLSKDNFGIVLSLQPMISGDEASPLMAQIIVNRLILDDDGNVCLNAPTGLNGILDCVDMLKLELDKLANEAVLTTAKIIASRRGRFSVISNDS